MSATESPDFPWLGVDDGFDFPAPSSATAEGIVGVGGNLSPGMLLSAYRQGIFPWFSDGEPVLWWCPDPRFVILPGNIHVSRSMRAVLRRTEIILSLDRDFNAVIQACATVSRKEQSGTWITNDMRSGYSRLHDLGYAHSCEAWLEGRLVGGVYGVSLGRVFFGESMFSTVPNASKIVLIRLVQFLHAHGFLLIDAQVENAHVASMGGVPMPRDEFLFRLKTALAEPAMWGSWSSFAV